MNSVEAHGGRGEIHPGSEAGADTDADTDAYTVLLVFESLSLDRFVLARHRLRGWELPGGRIEPGEEVVAAARREWQEETGLPLYRLEPLLLHLRPDGSKGHVFLGAVQRDGPALVEQEGPPGEEKIMAVRPFRQLAEADPLAFPDDPYAAIAAAAWDRSGDVSQRARRTGPGPGTGPDRGPASASCPDDWKRPPGEDRGAFVSRLSTHPKARPRADRVVAHPLLDG